MNSFTWFITKVFWKVSLLFFAPFPQIPTEVVTVISFLLSIRDF